MIAKEYSNCIGKYCTTVKVLAYFFAMKYENRMRTVVPSGIAFGIPSILNNYVCVCVFKIEVSAPVSKGSLDNTEYKLKYRARLLFNFLSKN